MSINYLSPLVEKQLPGFVREENPNFVTFLEKYYKWMETSGKPIYENYNLLNAKDIDLANDFFIKQIKEELLPSFPEEILLDDVKFLKTINQFYRSKGTPDSIKFLFKILYNEDIDIYFPSNEILKLSDGKWVLPLALRVETNDPNVFNLVKTQVRGTTSDATAVVEKVVSSVDRALGIQYIELFVSNVNRLFTTGENLTSSYVDGDNTITVTAKLIGSLSEVKIDPKNRGLFYKDDDPRGLFYYPEDIEIQYGGDPVTFVGGLNPDENANPKPAEAVVGEVLKGQINEIITIDGGFGFRRSIYPNTSIIDFKGGFASGRLGQESKAEIILVDEKTYRTINVGNSEIQSFYSNTINSIDNVANNKTINEITIKQSLNLYPIAFLSAVSSGGGYSSRPDIEIYSLYNEDLDDELVISSSFVTRKTNVIRDSTQDLTQFLEKGDIIRLFVKNRFEQVETVQEVTSNTITIGSSFETNINNLQVYKVHRRNLVQLGSLGRIKILNGGSNYNVGNYLIFTANGRGYGANAQVTQVHAGNNGIKAVEFNESSAYVRGGEGYTSAEFPIITVSSANGSNAQLVVSEILGDGEKVDISTSRIGAVSKIKVISYGYDYTSAPIVSLRNADLYLSNVTQGLLFTSNSKVYQGTSNTSTTFEAYFDKYVSGNSHIRIFNYIGTFDDTKQLKSFDNTISGDVFDYVFFGNGKAKANAKFENGLIRYPGIYLNEDGQPSSEKRFQDSNKYHNFSYVINTENDYKKFSKTLSDVLHPTGTKSFVTRIKKFENDVASLVITSNNFITTPLSNTFNVFVGTGIAVVTGSGANVNLASSIAVGDTIVFRNLLKTLNGTVSYVSGSNTITGNGTNFINDIYDGQLIRLVSGNSEVVAYVTNANSIITQNTLTSTVSNGTISLYYDEVDTVTFVNANTIFVSTIFPSNGSFVSANLKIDLGAASSLRDINISTVIPSINAYAGQANNFTPVIASGGIGGIAGYLISPVLPDGLVMISSNGNIRGTPTVIRAPITYTVTAYDRRSRGANATFTLGVTPQPLLAVRSIASRTISANTTATAFKPITPSGGYGSVRYSISPSLSAGVTFDPFTGEIGGIPSVLRAANTYTISMVDDASQNASNTFVLTVNALPVITSTIISSRTLTANVSNAFTPITATGGYGGLTYNIAPTLPTGLTFSTANGYIFGDTETTLVSNTFTVTANDGTGQSTSNTFSLTISSPPAIITSSLNRTITANNSDSFVPVTATGGYGTLTYSIAPNLPTGFTFNTANGYINGVTSILSSNTFTITVSDNARQNISNTFVLTINALPIITSTLITSKTITANVSNAFTPITATGGYGTFTYSISPSLPTGLTFNTANGYIFGNTETTLVANTFTVTANDNALQSVSNTFTLTISSPPAIITSTVITTRSVTANSSDSFTPVTSTGGYDTLTYAISPNLPTGLIFNTSNGLISGVTSVLSSNTTYTISVSDNARQTISNTFFMNVMAPALTSTMALVSRNLVTSIANSFNTLTASGGYGQITYGISPSLPSGLSLNTSNGFISGTATSNTESISYTVTANDQASQTTSNTFTMKVYTQLLTRSLIASRTLSTNVANSFLPVIAVSPSSEGATAYVYYFDGVNNGVRLPFSGDLGLTGDHATEFWIKANAASQTANATIIDATATRTGYQISVGAEITGGAGRISFTPEGSTYKIIATGNYLDDVWHHVACVRYNNTGYIYVDGVLVANSAAGAWSGSTNSYLFGGQIGRGRFGLGLGLDDTFTGYLSNFRVTNYLPVYTSNFTRPTAPFANPVPGVDPVVLLVNGATFTSSNSNPAVTFTAKDVLPTITTDSTLFSTPAVNLTSGITYSISPALPTGLTLNTSNGFISGNTAQSVIANTYTVTVNDGSGQVNSNTFILTTAPALNLITGIKFKSLGANTGETFTPANVSGGYGTVTYSISPNLPTGLTFNTSNGYISGVTTVLDASNTTYTINVSDYIMQTASNTFVMNVAAAPLTSTVVSPRDITVGIASGFTAINVSGGYGIITYSISPSLPANLTFNTDNAFVYGAVSTITTPVSYTVTANDTTGLTTSNTFTLTISSGLEARTLISSRIINNNVANSFLPVIAVTPQAAQSGNTYYFDGTTSGIGLRTDPGSALFFSTGDFTVEFWIKGNSASQAANSTIAVSHGTVSFLRYKTLHIAVGSALSGTSGKLYFSPGSPDIGTYSSVDRLVTPNTVLDDTWHHIACVRSSGTASIFVDGVKVINSNTGTWAVSTFLSQGSLGANSFTTSTDQMFTGYLSNFRALKNQALYINNFTPPISTLSSTSNTRLLLNSSSVVDSGPNTIPFNANTALPTVGTDVVFQAGYINVTTGIAYSISPSLPTGLSFNVSNGFISGNTAQTTIANTYTVTVTSDAGQSNSASFTLSVAPAMIMTTSITSRYPYIGEDPNFTPATATGGVAPITYSINGLGSNTIPYGTTLNTANGKISGTILIESGVSANYYATYDTIKVVATDAVGQQVSSANIYIEVDGLRLPFTSNNYGRIYANTTYASINIGTVAAGLGSMQAFLVPESLQYANAFLYPLAFSNVVPGMTATFNVSSNTIFISGTPTKAIGIQRDELNNYLGNIEDPTTTRFFMVQAFDDSTTWRRNGVGYPTFINIEIQAQTFYVNTTTSTLTFDTGDVVSSTPITVSGGYGVNGNITFALSGNTLPAGLTFITSNGAIVGVPVSASNANTFTVTANDSSFQTASNTFTLQVNPAALYANTTISTFTANTSDVITFTPITVSGGAGTITYAISGNTLPTGLTFITSNGTITGAAINVYTTNTFTITANDDASQTASNTFTLQVLAKPLTLLVSYPTGYESSNTYYFDGVNKAFKLPNTSNLNFGTEDFTIEFWMKGSPTQDYYAMIMDAGYWGGVLKIQFNEFTQDGAIVFNPNQDLVTALESTTLLNDETWHHIACVKSGNNGYLFVDGVIEDSATGWSSINSTMSEGIIGRSNYADATLSDNAYTGYLKNIRILKGTALYTSTFTPPSTVSAIANTVLLVNGSTITDRSNLALSFTAITVLPNVSTETIGAIYPGNESGESYYGVYAQGLDANTDPRNTSLRHVPLLSSNGGAGNITYSITGANSLPVGMFVYGNTALSADSDFAPTRRSTRYVYLGGIPDTITNTTITITANDQSGQSVSNSHIIRYVTPTLSTTVPSSTISLPLTATNRILMTATGGYGNISYTLTGNTLPSGLTFISSNAAIMGTPSAQASNNYTITAISQSSGIYFSNVSANITISAISGTLANVMSFNEVGSGFDEFDSFTWQGLAPLGTSALTLGSATPFTVEFWMKFSDNPAEGTGSGGVHWIINTDIMSGGTNGVNFWYDNGTTYFKINGSGSSNTGRIQISDFDYDLGGDNSWHHIALVRDGSSGKIFIDGTEYASTTSWAGINSSLNVAFIGNYQLVENAFAGSLSNFRVTKTALYTANFAVPTLPLVPITNTVLLINGLSTVDRSNNNLTVIDLNQPPTYTTGYI